MIDLAQRTEPYEIVLPYGSHRDRKAADDGRHGCSAGGGPGRGRGIERQARERKGAGLALDSLPDLSTEGERGGFYQAQLIRELAVRHITSWTRGPSSAPRRTPPCRSDSPAGWRRTRAPCRASASSSVSPAAGGDTVDLKAALCDVEANDGRGCHGRLPRSWWVQRSHGGTSMPSAGGVHVIIRALCRWHFQPGGGPEYCRACSDDNLPCAGGEPGADGRLCPYRGHALINRQEHEAWNVLLACQGQLRLAASGHVIGTDMGVALRIAAARGCDLAVLSELLPAAEAGLVEALSIDRGRGDGLLISATNVSSRLHCGHRDARSFLPSLTLAV